MSEIYIRVKNKIQLQKVLESAQADVLLLDFGCASVDIEMMKREHPKTQFILQLPDILREKKAESVKRIAEKALTFDGIVIKTFDEIALIKEILSEKNDAEGVDLGEWQLIGDAFLYAYNTEALAFYKNFFPNMKFILPDELTDKENCHLISAAQEKGIAVETDFIYKAYGYQPLMITNQCLNRNYAGCEKPLMQFADEQHHQFYITSECGQCYDIIYNGQPSVMLDKLYFSDQGFELDGDLYQNIMLDFTIESEEEMKQLISDLQEEYASKTAKPFVRNLTRGHHYKGVE